MALKKSQRSLKNWTKQKWRTKSGKKSSETGERYLPEKAIKSLSASEYAATTRAKRRDKKKGKQHSRQPKRIAKKTKRFRQSLAGRVLLKYINQKGYIMPMGMGTYGSKKGRPAKKKKDKKKKSKKSKKSKRSNMGY